MATFFQVRSLIDKATADAKEPTNGYLYVEINKLTEQSDSACTSVLDYLMKRLRAKAPRVKLKALVVMKNCIEKGHPTFRQELQLRAEEVRAELGCSGPADPHEGDGPYRRVREEADKVLNMMYDEQYAQRRAVRPQQSMEGGQDAQPLPPPSFLPSPAPGHLSSPASGGAGGPSPGKRYEGMGNWTPPTEEATWYGTAAKTVAAATSTALEKVGVKEKPAVDYEDRELYTRGGSSGPGGGGGGGYAGPTHGGDAGIRGLSTQQAGLFEKKKKKIRRKAGEAGGDWPSEQEELELEQEHERARFDYAQAQRLAQQHEHHSPPQPTSSGSPGEEGGYVGPLMGGESAAPPPSSSSSSSSDAESRLVEAITRPGGVRPSVSDSELADFARRSDSLEWRPLAKALLARLDEESWVVRLKTLCVVEALLERGRPKKLRSHLRKHGEAVVGETESSHRAVKQRAEAVAQLLWPDGSRPAGRAARTVDKHPHHHQGDHQQQQPAVLSQPPPVSNMLDFLDQPLPQHQPPASEAVSPMDAMASLNLGAPTLQAGPTFVAPPPQPYQQPLSQPYQQPLSQPYQQPLSQPYQQPLSGQQSAGAHAYYGQPMHYQPMMQQQQHAPRMAAPPPQTPPAHNDSFNFVQDVVKANVAK